MKYLNHNLLSRLGNLPLEARHSMTGNVSGRHTVSYTHQTLPTTSRV